MNMINVDIETIECPYCGKLHGDYTKHLYQNKKLNKKFMKGQFDMSCERCERKFEVRFYNVFHCKTRKKEYV